MLILFCFPCFERAAGNRRDFNYGKKMYQIRQLSKLSKAKTTFFETPLKLAKAGDMKKN